MRWAVEKGFITSTDNGLLNPTGQATRAQVAAMLHRYLDSKGN
ncbi:S-layer homology domain-containing protein [Intestinibacillus massiliensis]